MDNIHEFLRQRLLAKKGLLEDNTPKLTFKQIVQEVKETVWCPIFFEYMFNRLLMGRLRYGAPGRHDHIKAIRTKLDLYEQTGNDELLVDIGNYTMLEFRFGTHPLKHFSAYDDAGGHAELKK